MALKSYLSVTLKKHVHLTFFKTLPGVLTHTSPQLKGDGVGAKKLETAEKFSTAQIDEDGFLDLIRSKPAKKSSYDIKVENYKYKYTIQGGGGGVPPPPPHTIQY